MVIDPKQKINLRNPVPDLPPHPPPGDKPGWATWWEGWNKGWAALSSELGQDPAEGIFENEPKIPTLEDMRKLSPPEQEAALAVLAPEPRRVLRQLLRAPLPLSQDIRARVLRDLETCPTEWRQAMLKLLTADFAAIAVAALNSARGGGRHG